MNEQQPPYQNYPGYYAPQPQNDNNGLKIFGAIAFIVIAVCVAGACLLWPSVRKAYDRDQYNYLLNKADRKYHAEDYMGAADLITQAIALRPDKTLAYTRRGNAEMKLRQYTAAIQDYSTALRLFDTPKGFDELGDGNATDAEKRRFMQHGKGSNYYNLGLVYQEKGQSLTALKNYNTALTFTPNDINIRWRLEEVYEHLHQWQAAIANANVVVQNTSYHLDAYKMRAHLYQAMGDRRSAAVDFQHAISIKPDDTDSYFQLSGMYESAKQYDLAVKCWQQAVQSSPYNGLYWGDLGWDQYLAGQYDTAIATDTKALKLDHSQTFVHMNLALCYAVKGDWGHAKPIYEQSLARATAEDIQGGQGDITTALKANPQSQALKSADALFRSRGGH